MWRFALRREEGDGDDCSLAEVHRRFEASGGQIGELLVAIASSDAFLYRSAAGEGGS